MTQLSSEIPAPATLSDVACDRYPRHIAIIMDGNGRWAIRRNQPRIAGHRAGAEAVNNIVEECARLGISALTLYSFSIENWKRPADEVGALMDLLIEYISKERDRLISNNIRFRQIGRRDGLSASVLSALDDMSEATAHCSGMDLVLALNYSSRCEITDAVRSIVRKVEQGRLDADAITERTIADHLYTAGLPDPDLLIRTAGEMRVSNYLLWQISYAEIHVTDVYWPDFSVADLHNAIRDYASRNRRFGALDETNS